MLAVFLYMFPMGVCTIRNWQTSGRLVQELNVCIVHTKKGALSVAAQLCFHPFSRYDFRYIIDSITDENH